MSIIHRRSFLERLGLGFGAALLGPIATTLVNEARGAVTPRKRVIFVLNSNGFLPYTSMQTKFDWYDPIAKPPGVPSGDRDAQNTAGVRDFPMPGFLQPLTPYRDRLLLLDGLSNRVSAEHCAGFGALSCVNVARGDGASDGPPGGITIDQFIANVTGKTTPLKSLLWGTNGGDPDSQTKLFAAGRERPVPHVCNPTALFRKMFGDSGAAYFQGAVGQRRRLLMDPLREDLKELSTSLAATERRKLDNYTAAIEEFESRLKTVQAVSCQAPGAPGALPAREDRLMAMNEMSILAVTCGMTNVVGVAINSGNGHNAPAFDKLHMGTKFEGEGRLEYDPHGLDHDVRIQIINKFLSTLVARMAEAWSAAREGDRTVFDNTTIVFTSDNAAEHHSVHSRWPLVVLGNAGGVLKADGRFVRYQGRALGDFFSTLAHAAGAPTDTFGMGGPEQIKGPLSEIMV